MTNFSTPLPLYVPAHILDDSSPFPQLRTYLMDGLFLNQKTNSNTRKSYSLKYKYSNKKKNYLRAMQRYCTWSQLSYLTLIALLLTRGFIALIHAFNLPTSAFNLATRAFSLPTRGFEHVTRGFELVTHGFELATRVLWKKLSFFGEETLRMLTEINESGAIAKIKGIYDNF